MEDNSTDNPNPNPNPLNATLTSGMELNANETEHGAINNNRASDESARNVELTANEAEHGAINNSRASDDSTTGAEKPVLPEHIYFIIFYFIIFIVFYYFTFIDDDDCGHLGKPQKKRKTATQKAGNVSPSETNDGIKINVHKNRVFDSLNQKHVKDMLEAKCGYYVSLPGLGYQPPYILPLARYLTLVCPCSTMFIKDASGQKIRTHLNVCKGAGNTEVQKNDIPKILIDSVEYTKLSKKPSFFTYNGQLCLRVTGKCSMVACVCGFKGLYYKAIFQKHMKCCTYLKTFLTKFNDDGYKEVESITNDIAMVDADEDDGVIAGAGVAAKTVGKANDDAKKPAAKKTNPRILRAAAVAAAAKNNTGTRAKKLEVVKKKKAANRMSESSKRSLLHQRRVEMKGKRLAARMAKDNITEEDLLLKPLTDEDMINFEAEALGKFTNKNLVEL